MIDAEAFPRFLSQLDSYALLAPAVHLTVCLNVNDIYLGRNFHASQATGEGLLVLMRMIQDAGSEHFAVLRDDPPGISILVPAGVIMS
jgi:hypothetical protein